MSVDDAGWAAFLEAPAEARRQRLDRATALVLRGAVDASDVLAWERGVLAARRRWTSAFHGEQRSLGLAYYTHLEEGKLPRYFERAERSDASVERAAPGLQTAMRDAVTTITGRPARRRSGFAGAGVHVFLPGEHVAGVGGVVHADHEGLTRHQLARDADALTLVLALRPPDDGATLRFWPPSSDHERSTSGPHEAEVTLGAGDLCVFPSRRVHQIAPFRSARARMTATLHAVWVGLAWDTWF